LSISKVKLGDNSTVLDMLGEPILCEGKKEITALDGRHNYLL
jgi:hypothetical protein